MKYASAAAFRRALETRLLALSRDGGESLVRLRKSVDFDRLLARLFAVAPESRAVRGQGLSGAATASAECNDY